MRSLPITPWTAADASTTLTSQPFLTEFITRCSVQGTLAGGSAPTGTLKLQFSNDKPYAANMAFNFVPTHWSDVPGGDVTPIDNGVFAMSPLTNLSYPFMRLVWTPSSAASTTITVNFVGGGYP